MDKSLCHFSFANFQTEENVYNVFLMRSWHTLLFPKICREILALLYISTIHMYSGYVILGSSILNANYDMTIKSRDANIINSESGTVSCIHSQPIRCDSLWIGRIENERYGKRKSSSIQLSPYHKHFVLQNDSQSSNSIEM